MYSVEELEMIAELCRKHDVIAVADEVYEWLVYKPAEHVRIGMCYKCFILESPHYSTFEFVSL